MNSKIFTKKLLENIVIQVDELSEDDISKVESGTHNLIIRLTKKKSARIQTHELTMSQKEAMVDTLQKCASREEGFAILSDRFRSKNELEQFAKYLDVLVLKQDKADPIKEKIVEATIGAVLRSNAIQGKKYGKPLSV